MMSSASKISVTFKNLGSVEYIGEGPAGVRWEVRGSWIYVECDAEGPVKKYLIPNTHACEVQIIPPEEPEE